MGKNVIQEKSYEFAVEVIKAYQMLKKEYHEYDPSRQFLRSGTSIGANIQEAVAVQSRKGFFSSITKTTSESIKR